MNYPYNQHIIFINEHVRHVSQVSDLGPLLYLVHICISTRQGQGRVVCINIRSLWPSPLSPRSNFCFFFLIILLRSIAYIPKSLPVCYLVYICTRTRQSVVHQKKAFVFNFKIFAFVIYIWYIYM